MGGGAGAFASEEPTFRHANFPDKSQMNRPVLGNLSCDGCPVFFDPSNGVIRRSRYHAVRCQIGTASPLSHARAHGAKSVSPTASISHFRNASGWVFNRTSAEGAGSGCERETGSRSAFVVDELSMVRPLGEKWVARQGMNSPQFTVCGPSDARLYEGRAVFPSAGEESWKGEKRENGVDSTFAEAWARFQL